MTDPASNSVTNPVHDWLRLARAGSSESLGRLFELLRPYLLFICNEELSSDLRGKVGASDVVQETFLKAQEHFGDFRDHDEAELRAWLRTILLNNIANVRRRYLSTQKRELIREYSIEVHGSGLFTDDALLERSPSSIVGAEDEMSLMQRVLQRLPEEYRTVLQLRNYERLPFEEIALRLQRTAAATRKLWVRAVERLKSELGHTDG